MLRLHVRFPLRLHWFILCTRRSGGTAHEGGGCHQPIGSTASVAIVRSWSWFIATRSSPLGCFSTLLQVVDNWPHICGTRFSTGRLLHGHRRLYFYLERTVVRQSGLLFIYTCSLYFFPYLLLFLSYLLPPHLYFIIFLVFPCASVWENTRAWAQHFLWLYWMVDVFFLSIIKTIIFLKRSAIKLILLNY